MKTAPVLLLSTAALTMVACSTPKERAYEAQEKVHKERLELVDDYKDCMKDAGDDKVKAETCDRYLKAAEALK